MARQPRASAAAAAKRILSQAQEDNDAPDTHEETRSRPRKRRRQESPESSGYESTGSTRSADEQNDNDYGGNDQRCAKIHGNTNSVKTELSLEDEEGIPPATKKRRTAPARRSKEKDELHHLLFSKSDSTAEHLLAVFCKPPERIHTTAYHRPLLLAGATGRAGRRGLLAWYDSVSAARGMPWRKPWLDPRDGDTSKQSDHREALAKRAYEVWISEIMAQQTRIAVVIGYWSRWMERWPTLPDLARAKPDDVLAAWRGLGYYSRAARIHTAAQVVARDPHFKGLLPADVATLQARVPGVGRYTAGAISAIVFGQPAAMVDGNVLRVLSRQLGLYVDSKADKAMVDLLWAAAEALVQAVARDGEEKKDTKNEDQNKDSGEPEPSDRPGRWGQALMELGSTVCGPKPDCSACPIRSTCRAYSEGLLIAQGKDGRKSEIPELGDLEDACQLCEPFSDVADEVAPATKDATNNKQKRPAAKTKWKQAAKTISSHYFDDDKGLSPPIDDAVDKDTIDAIIDHAKAFPLRKAKKAVRELETLVCAVRSADGRYLLQRRPAKGLLAGLWQLPSHDLASKAAAAKPAARRKYAEAFVSGLLLGGCSCDSGGDADSCESHCLPAVDGNASGTKAKKNKEQERGLPKNDVHDLGPVPWLFSHIRQTMHVCMFDMDASSKSLPTPAHCSWATLDEAEDDYSMGTGMRKCWHLVKKASA